MQNLHEKASCSRGVVAVKYVFETSFNYSISRKQEFYNPIYARKREF